MKKILLFIISLAFLGVTACEQAPGYYEPDDQNGASSGFTMHLKAPWTPINTYAPVVPVAGENDIFTLHMLFFERSSTGKGLYKGFYSVEIPEGKPLNMNLPVSVVFNEETGLSDQEAYNILLVANLDYYLPDGLDAWKAILPGMRQDEVTELTKAYVSGQPNESVYEGGDVPLPMSAGTVKEPNEGRIDVLLSRTVARFDVVSHIKYEYDLVTASLWNAFPHSSIWDAPVDFDSTHRLERYYGIRNKVDPGSPEGIYEDIYGGLYTFENRVTDPQARDKKTTCLIVGLRNRDASAPDYGKVLYYRINILSSQTGQDLKRNNSYQITIRNVIGKGYNTEREAYEGEDNRLEIVINYWDLDDDGIIQYDGDNVLAVPMKRINIPREGDEREYSILTIGQGTLAVSRNTVPAGIDVILKGNRLYVNSTALEQSETERTGEIDLSFGALKATVVIRQSGDAGDFLSVSPTELPSFPAYAATQSGTIKVSASGAWKAAIFNPGFTFTLGGNVQEITSSTHGDSFTVSTMGANDENTTRYAFVKVTLTDNPEVSQMIVLKQSARSSIVLTPDREQIDFNPDGSLASGSNNVFIVNPGDDGEATPVLNGWDVILGDPTYFELVNVVKDQSNINRNTFTVRAKGVNGSNGTYVSTVKVYLTANPSVSKTMVIMQGPLNFSVSPKTFDPIPASGGSTPAITVSAPAGMTWSATVTTNLSGHKARIYTSRQASQVYELNNVAVNEFLYVAFPQLSAATMQPVATVTVRLDGTNLSETFTVSQSNLVPRPLYFHSTNNKEFTLMHGYSGYNHMKAYGENLKNWRYFGKEEQSVVKTTGAIGFTSGKTIPAQTTNYHANEGFSTSYRDAMMKWMNADKRNFLTVCIDNLISDQEATLKRFSSQYTLKYAVIKSTTKHTLAQTPAQYRNNKVWEYLTKTGPFTNGVELDVNKVVLYNCGGLCSKSVALTNWPSTAYPILMNPNDPSQALIVVDPSNRLVAIGSAQIFGYLNKLNTFAEGSDNWKFLNNLIAFTVNAGQYGDAFLDAFR